jgi:uncharacterized protein YdhG (YjbR/CyaY superfamily)
METAKPDTIDKYIAAFPPEVQVLLEEVRNAIKQVAPNAEEAISYAIPTFKLRGKNLVHFAAFKNHIGFYAAPTGHEAFREELSKYKQGKGSVQFPLDEPMPLELIKRMVEFRVSEMKK